MKTWKLASRCAVGLAGALLLAVAATAQQSDAITKDGVITGTMDIEFKTRTTPDSSGEFADGSPQKGVQDKYTFTLRVADTTEFSGSIVRQPNIYTKTLRKRVQGAAIGFDVDLAVLNPKDLKQKKTAGKWVGVIPIDTATGAYDLGAGKAEERPLRIVVDSIGAVQGFTDAFAGRMFGKAEKKDNLAEYTYKRLVGKRTVEFKVSKSDPMKFDNIELARGPQGIYPRAFVNGRLDYDYETGNWLTDGIRFKYTLDGKELEDVVTGTIKWVEDANRKTNGKGHYEFNLRFNEEKNRSAGGESAAFEQLSAEDAFFVVDDSVPAL
ncbi:MAG: hypothetical protein AB7Q17_17555, partial [Phycisphaerae bacterium]